MGVDLHEINILFLFFVLAGQETAIDDSFRRIGELVEHILSLMNRLDDLTKIVRVATQAFGLSNLIQLNCYSHPIKNVETTHYLRY